MAKKDKKEEIPSWIKDLYKEDLDRVVRGERPMYFRGMDDSPLRNVSPEFDILSGGAAVKGMNGIRGALSPLNNGMGNYNFSIRGINKKIGELVDEAGLYLPEKLRPVYRTVVDAMSSSKDKGLGYITQPLANALYPADERRNRRLDGEHPVGYVDAIDGIWPMEKYGLWGEKIEDKQDGGEIEDIARKMYRSDLDRVISGQSPIYYKQLDDKPLDDTHPEFDILTGGVPLKSAPSYKMGIVGKGNVFDNPWESSIYGRIFDKLDDYASIPNDVFTKYLGKTLRGIKKRIPDKDDKKRFQDLAEKVVDRVHEDLDYYVGLGSTILVDDKEDKKEGGSTSNDDYDIEWVIGGLIPSSMPKKKYIDGGGVDEGEDISKDDLEKMYSDDLRRVINGDRAVYFGYLNDKPLQNVHPELFLFPAINAMVGAVDSVDDIKNGRYSDAVVDIAMGFLPDALKKVSKKAIRSVINSVVSSDLFSRAFLEKKVGSDIVNKLMRNKEWNNFLNGINGDNYYRLQKKKGADSYMDDEKLYVSHTTPWEEFIPEGSEDSAHNVLYELPTSLLGRRRGSNNKGAIGDRMVDEIGFDHLMYGNRSSGRRDFVRVIDDENANKLGMDPFIIGISDRPLTNRGFYNNNPYYENVLQGNQTVIEGRELKDALTNGIYNLYEKTRDGIQKTVYVGDGKGGLTSRKDGGSVNTGRPYGDGKYVVDPRRSENNKMAVYDEIWDYLTEKKGIPQTQAIGILSNIAAESGGDTTALGAAGDFGIQQWLGPRKKELQRRYGKKPTLIQQLDYLVDEYQGRVPGLGWNYMNQGKFFDKDAQGNVYNYYMYSKADFDNATNYKDATVAWNQGYGRPLGSTLRNEKRLEFADMFSNRYGVPEIEPMKYEFGQRDSGTGDGGQQPIPETVASADPSLASRPAMDSWWEKEGQDLLYKMLAQSGANKKAIEDIANNIKNDPQSEAQIAEAERMRKEQAKRQLVLNMIPGLILNIKGMSSIKSEGGPIGDDKWFYDKDQRKRIVDKQEAIRALSKERHKILNASRSAFQQGLIDEDQFRRMNNLPIFKLSDNIRGGGNKDVDLLNSLFDTAMYDTFGESVKKGSEEGEIKRKERFYPYKLMADTLLTIGDIATASPGFLRLIERSGARLYPLLNNIAHSNSVQKISGVSGIGVDSSQIALSPDDDNFWNILGVAGAAAELIGGMDILRNTNVMGRIGNRLDDILDIANPVVTLGGLANDILD